MQINFHASRQLALTCPVAAMVAAMLTGLPGPAAADLTICNQTAEPAGVAIGLKLDSKDDKNEDTLWRSEGWWTLEPGRCKALIKGHLTRTEYYLYALHYNVGGRWQGLETFCIDRGSFSIKGRDNCEARKLETANFLKIITAGNTDWQHNLTDAVTTASQGPIIDHTAQNTPVKTQNQKD